MEHVEPMNLLLLLPPALAILLGVRLVFGPRAAEKSGMLRRVLVVSGLLLLWISVLGILVAMSNYLSVFSVIAVAMVTAVAVQRLRDSNREGLLWALTIAAERKVPLHHAAWAFAGETTDTVGSRAWQIGDALEQGASLPLAIEYVGLKVSTEVAVAARVGQSIDHLSGPLREALTKELELRTRMVPLLTQVVYLAIVAGCSLVVSLFASLRLVPVMRKMLAEVGVETDETTTIPWYFANVGEMLVAEFSTLPIPVQAIIDLVLVILFFAIVILLLQFVFRAVPRNLPLYRRLLLPLDRSVVLRALAWNVEYHKPIVAAFGALAATYPRTNVARKLRRAARSVETGTDWAESLRQVGLIKAADVPVLKATEHAGNLAWGMRQLADRNLRRLTERIEWAQSLLVPLGIVGAGVVVCGIVWSVFYPLVVLTGVQG